MDLTRKLLSEYYSKAELKLPHDFTLREFAFQTYKEAAYVRHLSFQSISILKDYLVKNTPRQAYYSSALYRDPAADKMEDKGWLGSELLFDIDSDHIAGCERIELSSNNKKVVIIKPSCIELAKEHELRLLDILKYDFGFSSSEITIQFSGNRGFHTVVRPKDKEWMLLQSHHRRELVDYIKGVGLDFKRLLPKNKRIKIELSNIDGGWLRRFKGIEKLNYDVIDKLRVEIDEQVTQDISRLIRIPGSINGKLGLPAIILRGESDLLKFKYVMDLSPFKGYDALVKLHTNLPRKIEFLNENINISDRKYARVPLPFALFLSLNSLATIVKVI